MACRRGSCLVAFAVAMLVARVITFVASPEAVARQPYRMGRHSFDVGKVNVGVDGSVVKSKNMPGPLLEANEATTLAIQDCLEDGCSVEALMSLDQKLANDEKKIQASLGQIHESQKTEYSENGAEQIAWLNNFLDRSGSLRAQLQAVKTLKADGDFAAQLMRAAAVAFGGGRHGDYPKVGISPYTA